jgi:hypothetical protein
MPICYFPARQDISALELNTLVVNLLNLLQMDLIQE